MLSSSPSVMDMVPSLLPEGNKSAAHIGKSMFPDKPSTCLIQMYLQSCRERCTGRGGCLCRQTRHQTLCTGCVLGQVLHRWKQDLKKEFPHDHPMHLQVMLYISLQQKQIFLTDVEHYCWWHWQSPLLQLLLTAMSGTKQEVRLLCYSTLSVFNHTI